MTSGKPPSCLLAPNAQLEMKLILIESVDCKCDLYRCEDGGNIIDWAPLILEDVQADSSISIDCNKMIMDTVSIYCRNS